MPDNKDKYAAMAIASFLGRFFDARNKKNYLDRLEKIQQKAKEGQHTPAQQAELKMYQDAMGSDDRERQQWAAKGLQKFGINVPEIKEGEHEYWWRDCQSWAENECRNL